MSISTYSSLDLEDFYFSKSVCCFQLPTNDAILVWIERRPDQIFILCPVKLLWYFSLVFLDLNPRITYGDHGWINVLNPYCRKRMTKNWFFRGIETILACSHGVWDLVESCCNFKTINKRWICCFCRFYQLNWENMIKVWLMT